MGQSSPRTSSLTCGRSPKRELPEPTHDEGRAVRLLAMEIDYGPFERKVALPAEVEIDQATAEQRNGLLWISLPLKQ